MTVFKGDTRAVCFSSSDRFRDLLRKRFKNGSFSDSDSSGSVVESLRKLSGTSSLLLRDLAGSLSLRAFREGDFRAG